MTILAHDRRPDVAAAVGVGARFCDLPDLLHDSDVISLNCSMSPDNRHLINADAFAQMSRQPILINCARGELIDEAALALALDRGQISGAGLDVLCGEPPDLARSGFTGRPNVILTPHVAFNSDMSISASRGISASNIRYFLDGRHENVRRYVHQALN
jgi:lactate dehydrogenase-like 2-hydroxyacid dehydrogenase